MHNLWKTVSQLQRLQRVYPRPPAREGAPYKEGAGGETWASLAGIKIVTVQEERGEEVGIVMAGTGRGKGVG